MPRPLNRAAVERMWHTQQDSLALALRVKSSNAFKLSPLRSEAKGGKSAFSLKTVKWLPSCSVGASPFSSVARNRRKGQSPQPAALRISIKSQFWEIRPSFGDSHLEYCSKHELMAQITRLTQTCSRWRCLTRLGAGLLARLTRLLSVHFRSVNFRDVHRLLGGPDRGGTCRCLARLSVGFLARE